MTQPQYMTGDLSFAYTSKREKKLTAIIINHSKLTMTTIPYIKPIEASTVFITLYRFEGATSLDEGARCGTSDITQ